MPTLRQQDEDHMTDQEAALRAQMLEDMVQWRKHRTAAEIALGPPVDHETALAMGRLKRVHKARRDVDA